MTQSSVRGPRQASGRGSRKEAMGADPKQRVGREGGTGPPLISVVVPTYNSAPFVAECLLSIVAQAVPVEVVVVDDGSTDDTVAVVRDLALKEVQIVQLATNHGACHARNVGWRAATGEFIKFLDADDVLGEGALRKQWACHESCGGEVITYGAEGRLDGEADYPTTLLDAQMPPETAVRLLLRGRLQTSLPLHRKAHLAQVGGFDERLKGHQEWNLHIRLAAEGFRFQSFDFEAVKRREHASPHRITVLRQSSLERSREAGLLSRYHTWKSLLAKDFSAEVMRPLEHQLFNFYLRFLRSGKRDEAANLLDELAAHGAFDRMRFHRYYRWARRVLPSSVADRLYAWVKNP